MTQNSQSNLDIYGTIYLVLGIIGALGFLGMALNEFNQAGQSSGVASRVYMSAGLGYLLSAPILLLGGVFIKAVTNWMISLQATVNNLQFRMGYLEGLSAATAATTEVGSLMPRPVGAHPDQRPMADVTKGENPSPAKDIPTNAVSHQCSNCGQEFYASRELSWRSCPHCGAPL